MQLILPFFLFLAISAQRSPKNRKRNSKSSKNAAKNQNDNTFLEFDENRDGSTEIYARNSGTASFFVKSVLDDVDASEFGQNDRPSLRIRSGAFDQEIDKVEEIIANAGGRRPNKSDSAGISDGEHKNSGYVSPDEDDEEIHTQPDLKDFKSTHLEHLNASGRSTGDGSILMRKFRYEFMMAYWLKYNANLEHLSSQWYEFTSKITNYGCFCFNQNNFADGKGQAKDLIDQVCKNLHKCQTCIQMDTEMKLLKPMAGGTCDKISTYSYNLTTNDMGEPDIECLNRSGTCKRALCECDKKFAADLANAYDTWNYQWKGKKAFVREDECKSQGMGSMGRIDKCCGEYPSRFPYHSQDGVRQRRRSWKWHI